jgi:hypothetical protein
LTPPNAPEKRLKAGGQRPKKRRTLRDARAVGLESPSAGPSRLGLRAALDIVGRLG